MILVPLRAAEYKMGVGLGVSSLRSWILGSPEILLVLQSEGQSTRMLCFDSPWTCPPKCTPMTKNMWEHGQFMTPAIRVRKKGPHSK